MDMNMVIPQITLSDFTTARNVVSALLLATITACENNSLTTVYYHIIITFYIFYRRLTEIRQFIIFLSARV